MQMAAGARQNFGFKYAKRLAAASNAVTFSEPFPGKFLAQFSANSSDLGLEPGQPVYIQNIFVTLGGITSESTVYNGYFIVNSVSGNSFTYYLNGNPQVNGNNLAPDQSKPWFEPVGLVKNWCIERNYFEYPQTDPYGYWNQPSAISMGAADLSTVPYVFQNTVLQDNVVRQLPAMRSAWDGGFSISASEKLLVQNNVIDTGSVNPIVFSRDTSSNFFINQNSGGNNIPAYNSVAARTVADITTLIDEASTLCL